MSSTERTSAVTMGWNQALFEDDEDENYDEQVRQMELACAVFKESWDNLSEAKQKAATNLGLRAEHFGQNHDGSESDGL